MTIAALSSVQLTDRQFAGIRDLVKVRCGINLGQGKKELVKARLARRLRELGLHDFDRYITLVRNDASGAELTTMLDAISTNLTSFFREIEHFEYLAEEVIPELVSGSAGDGKRLRIWSAGCSSGEEAYSIAITLCEGIPAVESWDVKILATDISTRVLAKAARGIYDAERLKTVAGQLQSKYFAKCQSNPDGLWQIRPALRSMVHVAQLNLMDSWPMRGPFDVIFCRNVMIYFDKATQSRLIGRYWDMLRTGGTLFIGHSESLAGVSHKFQYVQPTVYRKA